MLRRSPIFVALAPEQVSSGLQPDKHPLHRVLWDAAENVTFFGGKVRRRVPAILAFDAGAAQIRGLSQQQASNGVRWLWAASGGRVTRWSAGAPEEIIAAATWQEHQTATALPTFFDFTQYGDWTVINSGIGQAQLFKGPGQLGPFGDSPSGVARFLKKMNFIMALGYGSRGTRVGWSDSDNIETWTGTNENLASALSVDDFDTPIRAAERLGTAITVFAEDQIGLINYIGPPTYFGQRVVLDGVGAVGKMAVASDGKNNLGVGQGGIWWTDGLTYRYIDEGWLHDYLQESVNWSQAGKIITLRNDYTGCFEFWFPMGVGVEISEGWSFDPRTGGWSKLTGAVSLKDERRLFGRPISGMQNGDVMLDARDPAAAAALVLETKPLLMQIQSADGLIDAHNTSRIDEVLVLVKSASNVEFRLKSAQDAHAVFEAGSWMALEPLARTYKLGHLTDGVYWKLEFRSTASNWDLDLQGFMLFGAVEGSKRSIP